MMTYILKTIICAAIFYAFYFLLLSKEKSLVFNRFYLLASLVISFLIPLITFEVIVPAGNPDAVTTTVYNASSLKSTTSFQDYWQYATYAIAAIVSTILLVRFIKNILQLKHTIAHNKQICLQQNIKLSLLDKPIAPFSFLNTIFLNKTEYQQGCIEQEVLVHELAHIQQKHSLDILFIELLQIVAWFNPILYLYKHSIKINHELLADAAVVKKFDNVHNYQNILLQRATALTAPLLTSNFNFFTTKKRLLMLRKTYNKKQVLLASLALIPIIGMAVFAGCNSVEKKQEPVNAIRDTSLKPNDSLVSGIVNKDSTSNKSNTSTKLPDNIKSVKVKLKRGKDNLAIIQYKDGKTVSGDVSTPEKRMAFEQKYGVRIPPPPPPKVAPPKIEMKQFTPPKIIKDSVTKETTSYKSSKDDNAIKTEPHLKIQGNVSAEPVKTKQESTIQYIQFVTPKGKAITDSAALKKAVITYNQTFEQKK